MENDLQLRGSYESSPPPMSTPRALLSLNVRHGTLSSVSRLTPMSINRALWSKNEALLNIHRARLSLNTRHVTL